MGQPAVKRMTWSDYESLPDDGNRYEVLEGELVMVPAPDLRHQKVSWRLTVLLDAWQRRTGDGGLFLAAPTDVEMNLHNIVQPDLLYVRAERVSELAKKHIEGMPDLVVEIFNRAGAARDRVLKLQLYARYGAQEYWLIDLDEKTVTLLERVDGLYRVFAEGGNEAELTSKLLPGFALQPLGLFEP